MPAGPPMQLGNVLLLKKYAKASGNDPLGKTD
jgi:hypothetical protein